MKKQFYISPSIEVLHSPLRRLLNSFSMEGNIEDWETDGETNVSADI